VVDLNIERYHNFIANDVVTHNSLYRFRGADAKAFPRIAEMLKRNSRPLQVLPLPVNYRCDKLIIEYARQWVPALEGNSQANGLVDEIMFGEAMNRAHNKGTDISLADGVNGAERSLPTGGKPTTFAFLCRINVPLVVTAYQLIGQGKRVCIIGRSQIAGPLKQIIEALCGTDPHRDGYTNRISNRLDQQGNVMEIGLMSRLAEYLRIQNAKLRDEKYEKKLEALQQNVECIEIIATRVKDDRVSSVMKEIDELFTEEPEPGVICLSTVHRAKGLEWDVVFILRPDLLPHPLAKSDEEMEQEQNCCYVASTRARHRLYYVSNWPFGGSNKMLFWTFNRPEPIPASAPKPVTVPQPTRSEPLPVQKPEKFIDNGEPF
jgi:hypothetical protein